MGASVSTSWSQTSNPLSDIKPTLENSPTDYFINRTATNTGSNVGESLLGDSLGYGYLQKSQSAFGDSLTNSNQTINLSGGSSITDGGAIMAMFQLASKSIEANTSASNVLATQQAAAIKDAQSSDLSELFDKFVEFFKENKTLLIAGGAVVAFLIYKGVTK